ncbi:MAG: 2OG-Fe(II) oxygenase [Blastocatellia bacterium]|nr:2OG-Fe(II) oxygenase [Blastocatellia bacterium]
MSDSNRSDVLSIFPGALSPEECRALIDLSEAIGYSLALIEGALDGPFGFKVRHGRNNSRSAVDDSSLADALWRRVAKCVPASIDGRCVIGLNERLRFYRYEAGQDFGTHTDGYYLRANGEQSLLTLMVYLNDDYAGGETYFLKSERLVSPRTGTALIFTHALWHEGRAVTARCKYILRTDVMYGPEIKPSAISRLPSAISRQCG